MATTTNYGWTTPDDTALVKDGASAIRSLGTSVDTTTKNLNPSTTLGDIEYRSSTANTNTRLAIGSTGNVLTVAGGVPTWAAPAAPATTKSYSLLNAGGTALTGATTITVSSISGYDSFFVYIVGASSANASSYITLRFNSDTGNNYSNIGLVIKQTSSYATTNLDSERTYIGNDQLIIARMSDNAGSVVGAYARIDGANTSGLKMTQFSGSGSATSGSGHNAYSGGGVYSSTSVISSISVVSSTGNFDAGTVYIYGAV